MSVDIGAARRTFTTYAGSGLATRAYVVGRLIVAPLASLDEEMSGVSGQVLSLGCGHAVVERYLAERNPAVRFEGIDLDPRLAALIDTTAARSPRVSVRVGDATLLDARSVYDAVLVCDALHHFPPDTHKPLADAIAGSLVPGGVCIIKDLDVRPRWKHEWNRLHDRIVAGPDPITCRPPGETADLLAAAGLAPERAERMERPWTPYAHYVVRARKPR